MRELVRPVVIIVAACIALFVLFVAGLSWYGSWADSRVSRVAPVSDGECNIAVVPIQGDIVAYDGDALSIDGTPSVSATSGDWVERYIADSQKDPNILGIMARVDSYGGLASPGYQMMRALKNSQLPTLSYIREAGLSAGYMASLGSEEIIASPFASVGSIGVTYSYIENSDKNTKDGVRFVQLSSGKFKDTGNPNKPVTAEERALYQRDIGVFSNLFIDLVASSRKLSTTTVAALADGSDLPASLALKNGLIDQIGDEETAKAWFAQKLGIPADSVIFCK